MKVESLYVNNFRCLQNFTLDLSSDEALLLLARNGMGKSTVLAVLRILSEIARGETRVNELFNVRDFSFGNQSAPIRIKLRLADESREVSYELVVALNGKGGLEIVKEVFLALDDESFVRDLSQTGGTVSPMERHFSLEADRLALPQDVQTHRLRQVLSDWVLVMPSPSQMKQTDSPANAGLEYTCANFLPWFKNLLGAQPFRYGDFTNELGAALRDFVAFRWNDPQQEPSPNLYLTFESGSKGRYEVAFGELSDGEKSMVLGAALIVLSKMKPGYFCFWDEPDNYLAVSDVQGFITRLRKSFRINGGQLLISSHNLETIRTMGLESTVIMRRPSHLEPASLIRVDGVLKSDESREQYIQAVLSGDIYEN